MAERVRAFDWSQTPLGPMEQWPEALRVAVDICLSSRFPMFVWWGPQQINIYNDGYVPMLGKRHPAALGRPARESWNDIWDVVGPQAEAVLQRGEATWNERVKLVMERNGYWEDTYFTWSYSPIRDSDGRIAGLFCAVTEETERVRAEAERDRLAAQRQVALDAAGMGWWHYDPQTQIRTYDRRVMEIFGVVGQPIGREELLNRVHPQDRPALQARVQAALDPRNPRPYSVQYRIIRDDGTVRWLEAHGLATFDGEGDARRAVSFVGTIADITERRRIAEQPRIILESITDAFFALDREWRFTFLNSGAERLLMRRRDELLGQSIWKEFPAAIGSTFEREYRRAIERQVRVEFEEYYPPLETWFSVRAYPSSEGLSVYFQGVNEQRQSQEHLRRTHDTFYRLIHNNPFGVYVVDADFKLREVSLGAQKVFSSVRPLIGRDFAEVLRIVWPEPFASEAIGQFRQTLESGEPYVAMRTVEKRADVMDIEAYDWRIERIMLPDGRFGVVCYFYDLTERQKLDEALRETERRLRTSEERLALSIDSGELGTFYCPMPLGRIEWNAKCKEHFWLPPDAEVDFELFYSIIHPEDRQHTREAVERAVFQHEQYDVEYRTVAPDGRQRWVRAKGRAYYDANGEPRRFDGVTLDVSDRRRVEDELRQIAAERERLLDAERAARSEAERASRMKDEFLATLGHELRTPLNAIMGWAQILRRTAPGEPGDDVKQGLEVIERNARAQTRIIEDLLDMSRIIAGKVRLEVQRIPLAPVIEAAVETVRPAATAKGVELLVALDPLAGLITGDSARLQQVFWNLLSNSVKHTHRGGHVQVVLDRVEGHLEVSVIDDGEGIDPAFLPHVFDRFRQADGSTTRKHGGLGLGLSIVKHLVELHGGTVRAASAGVGRGATFTVRLPLTPMEEDLEPLIERRPAMTEAARTACGESDVSLAHVKVLVVDDEPDARELVKRVLADCGARVFTAGASDDALQMLRTERPDVMVSDIGMPGEDGYALIRRIRALPVEQGGNTPAIALTAYARSEDRTRAMLAGFTGHIAKPVEPAELVATVVTLARGSSKLA